MFLSLSDTIAIGKNEVTKDTRMNLGYSCKIQTTTMLTSTPSNTFTTFSLLTMCRAARLNNTQA